MNIYIDESGSFVHSQGPGKWNVVAALAVAESSRRKLSHLMALLRSDIGARPGSEIKLKQVPEGAYLCFLERLEYLDAAVFFVATDAGLSTVPHTRVHQEIQAQKIEINIDRMKYDEGKQALRTLAGELMRLPPQLYVQLICQIQLMFDVVDRSILYFVQRRPATLGSFRWRVDRKRNVKNDFERAFEKLSPALLQTMSMRHPIAKVKGFDYSHMRKYDFAPDEEPTYLQREYVIEVGSGFNIGKLIREDMQFVDSRSLDGVQAVDLVASGVRRCLRMNFVDTPLAAQRLGALTVQAIGKKLPFRLMLFGIETDLDEPTAKIVRLLARNRRSMLVK